MICEEKCDKQMLLPALPSASIIVGAGNVVHERLLRAMMEVRKWFSNTVLGSVRIFSLETILFKDNKDWQSFAVNSGFLPEKTESIFDLVKESPKNNVVAWIETPSDTHLYYLRLLLDKVGFIVMEKPAVSCKNDIEQLNRLLMLDSNRKRVFFLSYYILEKALVLTFLKRPNSFYLHYLDSEDTDDKKDAEGYDIGQFYQSFLELGHIKSVEVKIIEKSDNRKLPQGGQLIETLIHHCLIASMFAGLPNSWRLKRFIQYENKNDGVSSVYLSAVGERDEKISLQLIKSDRLGSQKKQKAVLLFENGKILADFDKKDAEIILFGSEKRIKAGVIGKYKERYAVQCDMVYRCYLNQMDPANIDGLFYQFEVLEWLLDLDWNVPFQKSLNCSVRKRYWNGI